MFSEVDAHAFESVSSEEGDEWRVVLLHLVSDELKGLPHGVLYHLLLGLLHLLEPLVEVAEHLRQKHRVRFLKRLLHCHYPFLVRIYRVHQELDHVAESTHNLLFAHLGVGWEFGKLHFLHWLIRTLLHWLHVFLGDIAFLESEIATKTELVVEDGSFAEVHVGRLDHAKGWKLGSIERKQSGPASLKDVGRVEHDLLHVAVAVLLHSLKEYNSINQLEPPNQITPILPSPTLCTMLPPHASRWFFAWFWLDALKKNTCYNIG